MYFKYLEYLDLEERNPAYECIFFKNMSSTTIIDVFQGFLPCSYLGWTPSRAVLRVLHSTSGESIPPSFLSYSSLHGVVGVLGHINTEDLTTFARVSELLGSALYDALSHKPISYFSVTGLFWAGNNTVAWVF